MTDKQIKEVFKNGFYCIEPCPEIEELISQLKAKEQECEELKIYIESNEQQVKEVETLVMDNDRLINELDQLKAENDELKTMLKDLSYESQKFCYQIKEQTEQLEPFKDEYFKGLDNVVIAELAKKSIRITAENRKLEQTLTEIKEHFDEECKLCKANYINITDKICEECEYKQILQKISEVNNDMEND